MKIVRKVCLLIAIALVIAACEDKPQEFSLEKLDTEIAYWSSEKFQGREAGTPGNKAAREEIAKKFKEIGLEPLTENDYLVPFDFFYKGVKKADLIVHLKNGETKEFEYGTEWSNRVSQEIDIELPLHFYEEGQDITQEISKGSIIVTEEIIIEDVRAQLIKTENLFKTVNHFSNPDTTMFQITEPVYDYLIENKDAIEKVHLAWYNEMFNPMTEYNVAGKINGSGNKQAIVISAHFDHVGMSGKTMFPGSLDNATGLTGMLNLAELLKEDSKNKTYASDILFVGFNAEENGLIGSQHFVESLQNEYDTIVNINLDCIGAKDGGLISFVGETSGSGNLNELLSKIAESQKIKTLSTIEEVSGLNSDHKSFLSSGYQAINISQEKFEYIHTPKDTPENTDSKPLKQAIELVQEFVNMHHADIFEATRREAEVYDDFDESKYTKDMNFGEYKKVEGHIVFKLERPATDEELTQMQKIFSDKGFQLENMEIYAHTPDYELYNSLSAVTNEGEIGNLKKEDYEFSSMNLQLLKDSREYHLTIMLNGEIKLAKTAKKIETWELQADGERYNLALSTNIVDNVPRYIFLHSFNKWTNIQNESFTEEEIADFINSFVEEETIEFLLKLNKE